MPPPRAQPHHVCIVDEDAQFRALFRQILQARGYAVWEAPDGPAALELIETSPYRLVVVITHALSEQDSLTIFNAALADAALAQYHAYLLLSVAPHLSPTLEALISILNVSVISHPENLRGVLKRISQLARRLEARRQQDCCQRARRTAFFKAAPRIRFQNA
jgi:CheY-like chemotaxis protein